MISLEYLHSGDLLVLDPHAPFPDRSETNPLLEHFGLLQFGHEGEAAVKQRLAVVRSQRDLGPVVWGVDGADDNGVAAKKKLGDIGNGIQ